RPGALTNVQAERLRQIRDQGLGAAEIIAADYAGGDPAGTARATRYLREIIRYDLDEDARRGLARYLELAVELGLAAAPIGGQPSCRLKRSRNASAAARASRPTKRARSISRHPPGCSASSRMASVPVAIPSGT